LLFKLSRLQRQRLNHTLIILGVGCLLAAIFTFIQPLTRINLFFTDQLFAPESPTPNVVVIGIDDNTLETYGKWSEWRRSLHAKAVDNLHEAGARVIGFDVLFADTSTDDKAFAESIIKAGNVVLSAVGIDPLPPTKPSLTYERFLVPASQLAQSSHGTGQANITPDGDGVVRKLPLIAVDTSGRPFPALSITLLHSLFAEPLPEEYKVINGKLHLLNRDIPVDKYNRIRINYVTPDIYFSYLSYGDIIRGDFDPEIVKNKIVIIGMTATGELDTWATPVSPEKQPGVWIHVNVIDNILRQRFLIDTDWRVSLATMLLIIFLLGILLPRLKLKISALLVACLLLAYLAIVYISFDRGYVLNLLYPSLIVVFLYLLQVINVTVSEQSHHRLIKDLFGKYVSPQVASTIIELDNIGKLSLGGERRVVTVLFADMRGFTKMSERMSPEEVVHVLNTYLSIAIERVIANNGIINKFAGDNIMGVWNAPQTQKEHAFFAVKAAWESQHEMMKIQQEDEALPKVQFGIGINTGDAVAGNLGSAGRVEYTVIGDSVNLASRICSAAAGGEVWIGPQTYQQVKDYIAVEQLEPKSFKGKEEAVTVYKVTGINPS